MKSLSLLFLLILMSPMAFCKTKPTQADTLRQATVAIYHGAQKCQDETTPGFFGMETEWVCKFRSSFACTGTVTKKDGKNYEGLTAGHCFDWPQKNEYYISETVGVKPVLRKIVLIKFENDERYDYATFKFTSEREYPVIAVETDGDGPVLGTEVMNVNFAFGLVKQTVYGRSVSEQIKSPALHGTEELKGRFLVNIGVGPGASGSAVVDTKTGRIVGVVEAIFPGTQMPTVAMPTGKLLNDFLEDDSAGIEPKAKPIAAPKLPELKAAPSLWDVILSWFGLQRLK